MARVTYREIAEATGLTRAAVSLALTGKRGVSEATRSRVLMAAEKLGYRPEPALRVLSDMRWDRAVSSVSFAVYTHRNEGRSKFEQSMSRSFSRECEARGIVVESFAEEDYPNPGRVERIIEARGFDGVLFGFTSADPSWMPVMTSPTLPAVAMGSIPPGLNMHQVRANYYQIIELAWTRMRERSHRRIAYLHVAGKPVSEVDRRRLAYHAWVQQAETSTSDRIPAFCLLSQNEHSLAGWLDRRKPDAVLLAVSSDWVLELLRERRIPAYSINAMETALPGVRCDPERIGRSAAEMLTLLYRRGEPPNRIADDGTEVLLVNGSWHD